jgi:hypothetical protein
MKDISMAELEARRSALLRQLRRAGPLVEGSLATVHRKCSTPTCKCHRGEKHRQVSLCKKVRGKSHATHVPKDLEEEVRQWNDEYKRIKALLKDISEISEQIIRGYVKSRKRASKKPDLRLVDPPGGSGEGRR